jgi:hypothetical protein
VIARDNNKWNPFPGEIKKVSIGQVHNLVRYARPKKQVPTMQDQIRMCLAGVVQHLAKIGKEVRSSSAPFHARPDRIIEAQVGVGEKDYAQDTHFSFTAWWMICSDSTPFAKSEYQAPLAFYYLSWD